MINRVLLTSTSFSDTPGIHKEYLKSAPINLIETRGPHSEADMREIISSHGLFDGYLIGEDEFSEGVIEMISPRAKVISRYGVGLDSIDLEAAKRFQISVLNTPRLNHSAVAEHTFGLMLALCRKIPEHNAIVHSGLWNRMTGIELFGKTIAVFGFGHVGKEVAKKAALFGMAVIVVNRTWSDDNIQFVSDINRLSANSILNMRDQAITICQDPEEALGKADIVSIHMDISKKTEKYFDRAKLALCKRGAIVLNLSRGQLIDYQALAEALNSGQIRGFGGDVIHPQPVTKDNPLLGLPNVILTPHIGSRTHESVARQGMAAAENLLNGLELE